MKNQMRLVSRYLFVACAVVTLLLRGGVAFAQSSLTVADPWLRQPMAAAQQTRETGASRYKPLIRVRLVIFQNGFVWSWPWASTSALLSKMNAA